MMKIILTMPVCSRYKPSQIPSPVRSTTNNVLKKPIDRNKIAKPSRLGHQLTERHIVLSIQPLYIPPTPHVLVFAVVVVVSLIEYLQNEHQS